MASRRIQIPAGVEAFFREHRTGRRRLLALTYEFDPAAFERAFASVLRMRIQADIVTGTECQGSSTGARFWRARWPGSFHAKIICLLANDRVCVGLGSANLTSGGLGENLETWRYFEGEKDREVLAGVRDFLSLLDDRGILPRVVRCREFIEALPTTPRDHALLSTLHGRLIGQVVRRVRTPSRRVDILSPLNSDPHPVLGTLRKAVGGREYHLFSSEERVPRVDGIDFCHSLKTPRYDEADEGLRVVSKAHAKMYAFHAGAHVDLFWGSANLSHSAWLAGGSRANVDLLIHSRLSKAEWQKFLFKDLPPGHRWTAVTPTGEPLRYDNIREEAGWRLLHAIVEKGRVTLEASASRRVRLRLRTDGSRGRVECVLQFGNGETVIPEKTASRLGFGLDQAPRSLEWAIGRSREWSTIPVNVLEPLAGSSHAMDLAQQLSWEFTGRPLPRPGLANPPQRPSDEDGEEAISMDEEELTRSEHQGELDRFVLEWRSIARRVAASFRGNLGLRRFHVEWILTLVDAEARHSPEAWPQYKRELVRELLDLEREWHA